MVWVSPKHSLGDQKTEGQSGGSPGAVGHRQLLYTGSLRFELGSRNSKVLLPSLTQIGVPNQPSHSPAFSQPPIPRAEMTEVIKTPPEL